MCAKVLAPAAVSKEPLDLEHAGASLRAGQQLDELGVVLHYTLTQPDLQQRTHLRVSHTGIDKTAA